MEIIERLRAVTAKSSTFCTYIFFNVWFLLLMRLLGAFVARCLNLHVSEESVGLCMFFVDNSLLSREISTGFLRFVPFVCGNFEILLVPCISVTVKETESFHTLETKKNGLYRG